MLIAEDDENDALLLKRAFLRVEKNAQIHIVRDGEEALQYIQAQGKYSDRQQFPFPRVLITDLKMPRCTGFELLAWLQAHPECNIIPVIVFSASKLPEDVKKAYELGANAFFQKPNTFDTLVEIVDLNFKYWRAAEVPEFAPDKYC